MAAAQREDFAGWSVAVDQLLHRYAEGRALQALMLSGPEGILKEELALLLSCSFLCESKEGRPCGSCGVCHRIQAGSYANLLRLSLSAKEKSIKIDQLRELLQQLSLNPVEEGQRMIIITDVDLMTPQAQNALLKSLEEPEADSFFILCTANEQAVLPTVLSRCQVQRLLPWSFERCQAYFERRGFARDRAKHLADLANRRPMQALQISGDDRHQALQQLLQDSFMRVRRFSDLPQASALLKDSREDAGQMLDLLERQAQTALAAKLSGDTTHAGFSRASASAIKTLMEEIMRARRYLASNVSWQAVADRLLLVIAKEIYSCQWS